MANHTQLPIYKVAYDLLNAITDLCKNMPRDFKASIGGKCPSIIEKYVDYPTKRDALNAALCRALLEV